jgi:hypothetical protein
MPELGPQVQRAPSALAHGGSMLQVSPVSTSGAQAARHSHMLGFPNAGQRQLSPSPFTHHPTKGVHGSPDCALSSQAGEPPAPAAPPFAAPPFTAPLQPPALPPAEPPSAEPPSAEPPSAEPPFAEPPFAEPPFAEPPFAPAKLPAVEPLAPPELALLAAAPPA